MPKPGTTGELSVQSSRDEDKKKRILISTIGSRGEVQPILGLGLELQALGHRAVLCVPPNFRGWVESLGMACVPIGPDLEKLTAPRTNIKRRKPSRSTIRQMVRTSVIEQFQVMASAAAGCDLIVVAGDLQHAGRSIAESLKLPYVHATYCPVTLKSPDHPPPILRSVNRPQSLPKWSNRLFWMASDWHWNALYRSVVNEQRAKLGLAPTRDVPGYIATDRPWLAVDPTIAPAPQTKNMDTVYTGAWFLEDKRSLPPSLEAFLAAGEPPVYFGFGSMRARSYTSRTLIEAARALGRRAIISRGWANLDVIDTGDDCIAIGDVSHELLFPRLACVVHHGGAGTTTTAARAGTPQVVVPHIYDQYYWANRVKQLGIGVSAGRAALITVGKLASALRSCLPPEMAASAQALAPRVELHGARIAAERLPEDFKGH
jgi:vancomycin aglycone glucosyltransferase